MKQSLVQQITTIKRRLEASKPRSELHLKLAIELCQLVTKQLKFELKCEGRAKNEAA
jgi:hypothetical protein